MGRPSRGRSIRLQVSTTQDVLVWLETKGEIISDSIHRILENAMEQERETVTLRQACEILGVTMDILDQLIKNENILVVEKNRSIRVIKATLQEVDVDQLQDPNHSRYI